MTIYEVHRPLTHTLYMLSDVKISPSLAPRSYKSLALSITTTSLVRCLSLPDTIFSFYSYYNLFLVGIIIPFHRCVD